MGALEEAWERGRLGHAILLEGKSLPAIEERALALAGHILQLPTGQPPENHPDFHVVRPAKKMRQISIESIRELIRALHQSSHSGGHRVALLIEADRLHQSAANAFLKTLEEPPPTAHIFLATVRGNELLDTIRSRCHLFHIPGQAPPINDPAWSGWLQDFSTWLELIETPARDKTSVANAIFRLYGLVQRFQEIAEAIANQTVGEEDTDDDADSGLSKEDREAIEAGLRRGTRRLLLADIEEHLRDLSLRTNPAAPGTRPRRLASVIPVVEDTYRLLELNLNETAAIESMLLRILRLWSRTA